MFVRGFVTTNQYRRHRWDKYRRTKRCTEVGLARFLKWIVYWFRLGERRRSANQTDVDDTLDLGACVAVGGELRNREGVGRDSELGSQTKILGNISCMFANDRWF